MKKVGGLYGFLMLSLLPPGGNRGIAGIFLLCTLLLGSCRSGPAYYFKKKNTVWKKYRKSDKFVYDWDVDKSDLGVFPWLFESRDFLLGFIPDPKASDNRMQHFLYDHMLDKTYLLRWDKYESASVIDRYERGEVVGRDGDWFIGYVGYSHFDTHNILERVKDGSLKITDPVLRKILVGLDMDSNPILIFTKFKHL